MQLEQDNLPEVLIECLQNNQVQNDCNILIAKLKDEFQERNIVPFLDRGEF